MMKLKMVDDHDGEGQFPTFKQGTPVNDFTPVSDDSHWFSCVIDGHKTYVPEMFVEDGVLNTEYNPTELVVKKGQTVFIWAIIHEWFYVKDEEGKFGWIPASKVVYDW